MESSRALVADRADQITNTMQVHSDREAGQKVVGVGSCGLDYLAVVARYPDPDTKLRTENLEVRAQSKDGYDRKPKDCHIHIAHSVVLTQQRA